MLYVKVVNIPDKDYVRNIQIFFKNNYQPEWLMDPYVQKMIRDIDKTEVICENVLKSPVFGTMAPDWLSGGLKMLICLYKIETPYFYHGSVMGDNCFKWVIDMSKMKDIYLVQRYYPDGLPESFDATFLETNKVTHTEEEFMYEYFDLEHKIEPW